MLTFLLQIMSVISKNKKQKTKKIHENKLTKQNFLAFIQHIFTKKPPYARHWQNNGKSEERVFISNHTNTHI